MSLKQQIANQIINVLKDLDIEDVTPVVDYPADPKFGDYTTNVALVASKELDMNPRELAAELQENLQSNEMFEKVQIAGPGFVNFWVKDKIFSQEIDTFKSRKTMYDLSRSGFSGKKIVVEFAHPNTHKAFHIGHLRNITIAESVIRLLEAAGAEVVRVNYQGDVGMHIAKALYGILHNSEFSLENAGSGVKERVDFLGKAYTAGSKSYEEDEAAQKEIREINKKIYAKDASIWEVYQITRKWSLDYFETIYKRVDSHFDRLYFESEVYEPGKENVLKGLEKGVFEKSQDAIIFPGSKFNLHDRVFITSEGNPTYEGKEMGLGPLQFKENNPNLIMHVVGPEQAGYFQVVFEALAQLFPETRGKELHLAYGWVKLKHGKMSSRTGNVVLGEWLIDEAKKKICEILEKNISAYSKEDNETIAESVAVGAVKYSFLKVSTGQEIAFDLNESVSFDGNSGPYIQYTYARTQSVLRKSHNVIASEAKQSPSGAEPNERLPRPSGLAMTGGLEPEEQQLLRLLVRFGEVVEEAAVRYSPSGVATYLFELAQAFNLFYQKHQILKAEDEVKNFRLDLTETTGKTLKNGLSLLGIKAPEKM